MDTPVRIRWYLVVAVAVAVLLGAQALAGLSAPLRDQDTARVLGRTGFAYLGGLRTFAAAVIWNRIDPQHHAYFEGKPLAAQPFLVPKMRMVTILDPSFSQAYYVMSFIVFERVGHAQGIAVAREGLRQNPRSGELQANLAQLLFIDDKQKNGREALTLAQMALDPSAQWADDDAKFEGYATVMQIVKAFGIDDAASAIKKQLDAWRSQDIGTGDHDHDADGEQDH